MPEQDISLAELTDDVEFELERVETRRLVTFEIGGALYAAPIAEVAEIHEALPITPLPIQRAPAHVLGLVNLRGAILPVIDLCVLVEAEPTIAPTAPLLVIVKGPGYQVAIRADAVQGLTRLPVAAFKPAPASQAGTGLDFCESVAMVAGRLLMEINIPKLLATTANQGPKQ